MLAFGGRYSCMMLPGLPLALGDGGRDSTDGTAPWPNRKFPSSFPSTTKKTTVPELHAELAEAMGRLGRPWEVIYVDDGSRDRSYERLKAVHAADPEHVTVIALRRNFGQTAAFAAGFDHARGRLIVTSDGDLQNDPRDIPRLVETLEGGYDIVCGWRKDRKDPFVSRRVPSMIANGLISRVTGVHLHDYGCSLKVFRAEIVKPMKLYGEMHRFLPAIASEQGVAIAEVIVNHRARRHGTSKYGISRTVRVILDLLTVKFLLSYATRPLQIFGKYGFFCIAVGFISGLVTIAQKLIPPHLSVNRNGWTFLCMFFIISGLQLICMGLLGEMTVRTYYESQKKPIYACAKSAVLRKALNNEGPDAQL